MKYIVLIIKYDKRYENWQRHYYKEIDGYRKLRDFLVRHNYQSNEYVVYQETDIKIKKARGYAD